MGCYEYFVNNIIQDNIMCCDSNNSTWIAVCGQGYQWIIIMQALLLLDIDECTDGTSGCEQICNNTVGSYMCVCNTTYNLALDLHSCLGKSKRYVYVYV